MNKRSVSGVLIGLFCAGLAQAHHPLVTQRLQQIDGAAPAPAEDAVRALVAATAQKAYSDKPKCVAAGLTLDKLLPAAAERSVFGPAIQGTLRNGWTVVARHPQCDAAPVRYMIVQDAAGAMRAFRVNRGQSHAHESLIGDTWPLVKVAAEQYLRREKIACGNSDDAKLGVMRVADDHEAGPDLYGVRYTGSWSEIWPVEMCGQALDGEVLLSPDGDGGAYTSIPGDRIRRVAGPAK